MKQKTVARPPKSGEDLDENRPFFKNWELGGGGGSFFDSGSEPAAGPEEAPENSPDYRPESVTDLVNSTPADIVAFTEHSMLHTTKKANGQPLLPLPYDLNWFRQAPLEADVTYTMMVQVVHQELKKFLERLQKYYVLTPRTNVDETVFSSEDENG